MSIIKRGWPFVLILLIALIFFWPVFKGQIPFPGDHLINTSPYKYESYLGYAPGGYPSKGQNVDVATEIYPWRHFAFDQISKGEIPFWNPYNFSGNPLVANFQTGVFYPLNLFYLLFPFNFSWTFLIFLQPILSALFMYLFLQKGLGLKKFASFIGGFLFAFSSYMTVWLQYGNIGHTFLWLPLVLLLSKRLAEKITYKNFFLLILVLTASVLAGYIQGFFYLLSLSFAYFLYLLFSERKKEIYKKISTFIVACFTVLVLTSFQLYSTVQLFLQSTRSAYSLDQVSDMLLPVFYWVTFFVSDFFGNPATRNYWIEGTYIERVMYISVAGAFFALFAIIASKNKEKKFFLIAGLATLILTTGLPFLKYFYLVPIPFITTTVPTRILSVFAFCFIVLAAMGINHWIDLKKISKRYLLLFAVYVAIFTGLFISLKLNFIDQSQFKVSLRNMTLPTFFSIIILLAVFVKKRTKAVAFSILTLVILFDLFYSFHKIVPFSPGQLVYPDSKLNAYISDQKGIDRFWAYGLAYIPANYQTVDKIFSPEGNDPLHISSYGELLAASNTGILPDLLPRPDANIKNGYLGEDLRNNFFRKRVINLLGIKYIFYENNSDDFDNSAFSEEEFKLIDKIDSVQVYRNEKALPRYFLLNDFVVAKNKKEALGLIFDKEVDLQKTLILEKEPSLKIDKTSENRIKLISYSPNKVVLESEATGNSLLFISDNFYPNWKASIDSEETPVLRANYSFRAVEIPKGKHEIIFFYHSEFFNIALILSIACFLGLTTIFIIKR